MIVPGRQLSCDWLPSRTAALLFPGDSATVRPDSADRDAASGAHAKGIRGRDNSRTPSCERLHDSSASGRNDAVFPAAARQRTAVGAAKSTAPVLGSILSRRSSLWTFLPAGKVKTNGP